MWHHIDRWRWWFQYRCWQAKIDGVEIEKRARIKREQIKDKIEYKHDIDPKWYQQEHKMIFIIIFTFNTLA